MLGWLVEAAEHLQAFARSFLCDVHVHQVHLDELYAVLRAVQDGKRSEDEAIQRLDRSPYWVWTTMDPENKLLLVLDIGPWPWRSALDSRPDHWPIDLAQTVPKGPRPLSAASGYATQC